MTKHKNTWGYPVTRAECSNHGWQTPDMEGNCKICGEHLEPETKPWIPPKKISKELDYGQEA